MLFGFLLVVVVVVDVVAVGVDAGVELVPELDS